MFRHLSVVAAVCLCVPSALATVYGHVQGIVHDPAHRPLPNADVTLKSTTSDFTLHVAGRPDGSFGFTAVPIGSYTLTVVAAGFAPEAQSVTVRENTSSILHFELALAGVHEKVSVTAELQPNTATPTTTVTRADIQATPGADRTNSVQFITDYTPGAYVTHDMLHMRGGHQVSFLMDGVNVPNTNIASNVAAAISPRDIDTVDIERGSYSADEGDRTYGIFDISPKTGFDRDRQGELVVTAGSQFQTDDQISFGDHSQRLAWYASANGNRSNYGLAPPIAETYHDAENGFGGFGTLVFNRTANDQFRTTWQARRDFFQIPYDPDPNSFENQQYDSSGLRDTQLEKDIFGTATWAHTFSTSTLLQVSPFFHYNRSDYAPNVHDTPVATTSDRGSTYGGAQAQIGTTLGKHSLSGGVYGFGQHDNYLYGLYNNCDVTDPVTPCYNPPLPKCPPVNGDGCSATSASGGLAEAFVSDSWRVQPWLTIEGGVRQSHFQSNITDNVTAPRIGIAVQVPKLNWIFRGFYGRFYQPPPIVTLSSVLAVANPFEPLHGERDEEHQFGVMIPYKGWTLDVDTFRTRINSFLDHANIGESSIFVPITVDGALVRAWELTLKSPRLWHVAQVHLAYSNQIAEQRGPITGGLICDPTDPDCNGSYDYTPVDHDQRNTLSLGGDAVLRHGWFAAANWTYGSGFVNGDPDPTTPYPGAYLPAHSSVDLSLRKSLGETASVGVTATNINDTRVLLDNSLTYGGFHFSDPRMVYAEVRWKFKF